MSSPASRERLGLLLGFIGMAIFGGTLPATRLAVSEIDPITLTALRTAIAGLCSLALLLVMRRPLPPRALWPQLVIAMLCVAVVFPLLMSTGMQRSMPPTVGWSSAYCRSRPPSPPLPSRMSGRDHCSGSRPSPAPRW
jgi:drug/metabolite transporter (DMT)-like permease